MVDRNRFFGLHVGRDRTKERRLGLVGPVRPTKTLDRRVGLPAGFEQIVDAEPPVPRRQFGVVAAPCAARIGEDEDALQVVHEGCGLGKIGGGGAVLDHQPVAPRSLPFGQPRGQGLADDAAGAARHRGDEVRAEPLHDLVEGAGDRRERGELFDQAVAAGDGLAALDWLAIAKDGP